MIDNLKDLKDTYESVRTQIDKGKEPTEEMQVLLNFIKALTNDKALLHQQVDKDYRRFFYDDFTNGLIKRLTREKSRDDKYLETIAQTLQQFLSLFIQELKNGHYNHQFFDSIKLIFEYDTILHNSNFQIPEEQLKAFRSNNQQWRKDLVIGDLVDAIQDDTQRCSGWSQAKISQMTGDLLHLEFTNDTRSADRYLDRWSVEIAQFETKTKEMHEWKKTLKVDSIVDAHDRSIWNKSTILEIKEENIAPGKDIMKAFVAFRIYFEKGPKTDEKGKTYDGWSNRFDEWIPLFSPRIQPFFTKTQKGISEDFDIDEELDMMVQPEQGQDTVYAVPRMRKCISSCYINLINQFGYQGGFEQILNVIQIQQEDELDLNIISILMECLSKPYLIYHSKFQKDYCPQIIENAKKQLRGAPEKSLRDVKRERIEAIIKSIDSLQRRITLKEDREKETESLRLDISLICLRSNYLERRIQGIRDLNQIIRNNRMTSSKNMTSQQIIDWLETNDVYSILFDQKKTHLQIVQRTADILKLLLQEDKLPLQLAEQFWNLSKSDYKFEVYKIINEIAYYLKQEHIDYFFEQIKNISAEKLSMEEFTCLSELGKFTKDEQFKVNASDFFWNIICHSDGYKDELVNTCISKFCEMVKGWEMNRKYKFFVALVENLKGNQSSLASLKVFKGLIKDQKDKTYYNTYGSYGYSSPSKINEPVKQNGDDDQNAPVQEVELNLTTSIEKILKENQLIQVLLENLRFYCEQSNSKFKNEPYESRKKLFILNQKHSHHDEIDERLQFIKYIASISDFIISKRELGVIYDHLMMNSKIVSDQDEFLTWCKTSCEQSSSSIIILDLNEVGEFFTQKMKSKELDVKNLLLVGFDFLQHYFLSVNEKEEKLLKVSKPQKAQQTKSYNMSAGYYGMLPQMYGPTMKGNYGNKTQTAVEKEEELAPAFKLVKPPSELDQLDIVWDIALQCENEKVVPKAINFLIKVYSSLDVDINVQKQVQDELIEKCMTILRTTSDSFTIKRTIEIVKNIIYEAEKKGTGDVQPHNALLKGEFLERIYIKNRASSTKGNVVMSVYANTTVWEFRKEVAKQLDLAPKYLKLERMGNDLSQKNIRDLDNGKTLAQLGFQNHESINAYKNNIEEEIANVPLIGSDGKLSEKAKQIFNEWFDMYSNENSKMTKETCALFIKGCTGEPPLVTDDRIQNMFKNYDTNNDGFIEREDFLAFYESASRGKADTVRENLKAHNIRNDLKKLSEIEEASSFSYEDMPRYKISRQQDYFDILISILDRNDSSSQDSWDLIQMLATNQLLYTRVLELKTGESDGESIEQIDWNKFFDSQSVYKLLYTLQIIEAVMEEGEGSTERIIVLAETIEEAQKKKIPPAPPLQGAVVVQQQQEKPDILPPKAIIKQSSIIEENVDKKLRSQWTSMFLKHKGFQYILTVFMQKSIKSDDNSTNLDTIFELKHIAFLLKLLRIFIMAAFSTSINDSGVYESASLMRRSSSYQDEEQTVQDEGSTFKELQKLMSGVIGIEIIESINYTLLQAKIINTISQILSKKELIYEDKLIIENALSLWVGCALHRPELINDFYDFKGNDDSQIKNSDDLILHGLLFCPYDKVREEFKFTLISLSQKLGHKQQIKQIPLFYLLKLLSENFSLITSYHCKQYFDLFCELIDYYFMQKSLKEQQNQRQQIFDPEKLLSTIIDKIKEFNMLSQKEQTDEKQVLEEDMLQQDSENIYIGLIQLTSKIIDNFDISFCEKIVEQKGLIDEIFVRFLFSSVFKETQNSNKTIKIKSKQLQRKQGKKQMFGKKSKDAAYKLLNSLIKKSPVLMNSFLDKSMIPLIKLIRRIDGWNYSPPGQSERSQQYVGLRNLGCICYMISMLQQFFMIPAFRYNLLSVDDQIPEAFVEYKGSKIDDNVLHQLQRLMAHLELSERQDYNPYDFVFSFKDFEGQPTNIGEQKDAQEFLNVALERIENLLKNTSRKYLLQSVFGGKTCSQLICQECGKVKNRIEDFYNMSLTVKDIKSMQESLKKQIEGEEINDFQCDGCNKKVNITKRTLISQTPNVLIIHLQRIIFNFDTFKNDKINTFFEFPFQLDLKPYSFYEIMKQENRLPKKKGEDDEPEEAKQEDEDNQWPEEEDCFEYKLVGVNVHSGSAQSGHYWSYINTQRGFLEPSEDDPNWAKTEQEQWLEFNDSSVREFNFERLREECYGGDKTNNSDSDIGIGWSFQGSYGKSAYMLIYERRIKKPLKITVMPEELEETKNSGQEVYYDEKNKEHYKLIDYREGVEDIKPNQIYKQVFEDNQKFEFENDIYSTEFFDFVKGILQAILVLNQENAQNDIMQQVKQNSVILGKKAILDILSKCYYNQGIKQLVDVLIQLFQADPRLVAVFLQQCFDEDQWDYLFVLLLECPDYVSRVNISNLMKYVLNSLKEQEVDYLYQVEVILTKDSDGNVTGREERYKALSSRFIIKALSILNTQVARNWQRFEYFLEVLYSYATGEMDFLQQPDGKQQVISRDNQLIGLEFFFKNQFIEKACDFFLGKKSPLCKIGEKRYEMGGSFNSPNYSAVIKLVTKMIQEDELVLKYPLNEMEQKMFLQHDLLKVMLGSSQGSKQFGKCLATMCKDNYKLSKKVSKVFIKSINNSNYENVRNYLTALKPFLTLEDSLKPMKLEWVLGFSEILNRKGFREERFKYALEMVDKIGDEVCTYVSPIATGPVDDALLSQLLKCKGRLDTFAINCLKELLSLMAKDDKIARFIYYSLPHTYQHSRYSDWIRPYVEYQKSDNERANSYSFSKTKQETLVKSLIYITKFEEKCDGFRKEDEVLRRQFEEEGMMTQQIKDEWWAYENKEVVEHFPPRIIIGKQVGEEKEFYVDDSNPLVKVTIQEIQCEYNYSNPTGLFNLSLPHVELRTGNYQTVSYLQYKRSVAQSQKVYKESDEPSNNDESGNDSNNLPQEEIKQKEIAEIIEPEIKVNNWFERKQEAPLLLKVIVQCKVKQKVRVEIKLKNSSTKFQNLNLPISQFKETLLDSDPKVICHLQKTYPGLEWGDIQVEINACEKNPVPAAPPITTGSFYSGSGLGIQVSEGVGATFIACKACQKFNDADQTVCVSCNTPLEVLSNMYQNQERYFDTTFM